LGMTTPRPSPAARLRALMERPGHAVMMPGAFNALCAKAIADAGFEACYISGAAESVSAGVPDVGLLTLPDFCRSIRLAHDLSGLPIIADADTGFGESEMVRRTVIEYARAGAAGLHLEDQVFPKRCGHLDGKKLVPIDHACEKIKAAAKAARELVSTDGRPGLIVCARTDARGVEGFGAAVERARAYLDSGAEMIFPEGLTSETEFAEFAAELRRSVPSSGRYWLLANMTEFGRTPMVESNVSLGRSLGRDHHPQAFTIWLAGGGTKPGITLGQTDDIGFHITQNPIHVHDLQATILHLLGLDHERLTFTSQGRAFRLTDVHGHVVRDLIA